MDEEASFANLLSQSTAPARPSWDAGRPTDDPWANPFSNTPSTNPFATEASPFDSPVKVSPYVQKLEKDVDAGVGILPDPPSVIAMREQEQEETGFASPDQPRGDSISPLSVSDPALAPFSSPLADPEPASPSTPAQPSRKLPSELLDNDFLGVSDPSASLKKAFVKSTPAQRTDNAVAEGSRPRTYVFKPDHGGSAGPSKDEGRAAVNEAVKKPTTQTENVEANTEPSVIGVETAPVEEVQEPLQTDNEPTFGGNADAPPKEQPQPGAATSKPVEDKTIETPQPTKATAPLLFVPASIPLPTSSDTTPTPSRSATPAPPPLAASAARPPSPAPPISATTPTVDRVAVSPLDAPAAQSDYGFKSLSMGGSTSVLAPPPPSKSPVHQTRNGDGWPSARKLESPLSSRLSGRGWGVVDDEDDGGLFGKGGPSLRPDPWSGTDTGGWEEKRVPVTPSSAGSQIVSVVLEWINADDQASESSSGIQPQPEEEDDDDKPLALANGNSTRPKSTSPLFDIAVGDPTRVGDAVRGYTVYTIRTRTSSPHYRRTDFSVLRRFSDFLWLFDALTANNSGVIVPPMPDKHPFGRFQDQFIETRRLALQRCLTKITSHPILQLDPDLRLFLESDAFAIEARNRRAEVPPDKQGLLAGWTGPKFVEQDDWFDSRKIFLDNLESQLKSLSKSIETASKSRLDMAISMGDFADSTTALVESDLGTAMCAALARLADLARREKESNEEQAKSDVMYLLNMADEYVRFIGSVRLAFASRIKA